MPVIKKDQQGNIPTDASFTLLLFPDNNVSDTTIPTYNSSDPIKGALKQITIPTTIPLPIPLGAGDFKASFCETGFPSGWTFNSWSVVIHPFGGTNSTLNPAPFSPETGVNCISFSIPQGTDTVTMTLVNNRPLPGLSIVKKVKKIEYEYLVTNTGNVEITNLTVVDNAATGQTCVLTTLAAGASTTWLGRLRRYCSFPPG